jgi:hypothetical protein
MQNSNIMHEHLHNLVDSVLDQYEYHYELFLLLVFWLFLSPCKPSFFAAQKELIFAIKKILKQTDR